MRSASLASLFFLLFSLTGCSEEEAPVYWTTDYAPSALALYTQIASNGGLAQLTLTPMAEGHLLMLGAGDSFELRVPNGPSTTLEPLGSLFVGQLETDSTQFERVFVRGTTEFVSPLEIPPAFALSGPSTPVSRASPIPIHWGPPADGEFETWFDLASPCMIFPISRYFAPTMTDYEIQPADLAIFGGTTDCELRVWITRSMSAGPPGGSIGAPLAPGGSSVRSISISTTP